MTGSESRAWVVARFGETAAGLLDHYVELLLAANSEQNLISQSTEAVIWGRHILDSAQLATFAPSATSWLDIGSGAGLPGIVLAIVTGQPVTLVEPRRKRATFLEEVRTALGLRNAEIRQAMIEKLPIQRFEAVTARAVAPLSELFASAVRLTDESTMWVLPKGRSAERELAEARQSWQGMFHVEHSLSDPDSRIIVATKVRACA